MKTLATITLDNVKAVYSGAEGALWELIMGEQIHIGGMASSNALADAAGLARDLHGVDLCCCSGAGMRFLVRFRGAASMRGIDATPRSIANCRARCEAEGSADRIEGILADACSTGLPSASADFVWGEDAWCYVVDKTKLIAEAIRLVKPGGVIAFTDWVEGDSLSQAEAERFLRFMKFQNIQSLGGYRDLLKADGCEVLAAKDTGRFAPCIDLYLNMLGMQLTYDALQIIGFDQEMMAALAAEMAFTQELAHAGKIVQGLFVARKNK